VSAELSLDYWNLLDVVLRSEESQKIRQSQKSLQEKINNSYETIHWEIASAIADSILGGTSGWHQSANVFFTHNKIFARSSVGFQIPTPRQLIHWLNNRASEGISKTKDDEFAALLLFLFITSRLPTWYPFIDSELADVFSNFLETTLRRECTHTWARMAFYVAANHNINEHPSLSNLWNQLIVAENKDSLAMYFEMHQAYDTAKFNPAETVSDHQNAITLCNELVRKIEDSLIKDPIVSSKERYLCNVLNVRTRMEIAYHNRLIDQDDEALKNMNMGIAYGLELLGNAEESFSELRSEILSATSDAIGMVTEKYFDFAEINRLRDIHREISLSCDNQWKVAGDKLNQGSNKLVRYEYDDANRDYTEAYARYWRLHSLTSMDRLQGLQGRLYLAQCSSNKDKLQVTNFTVRAAIAGAVACDQELVTQGRRALETTGGLPTSKEMALLKKAVLSDNSLRKREKVGICYLLIEFIDYFEESDFDLVIHRVIKWTRESCCINKNIDIARNAIKVLKAACRVLPGLEEPNSTAEKIARALCQTASFHENSNHIILEIADVADAMAEIPREITADAAKAFLEVLKFYHWKPNTIIDKAWTSLVRPASIHGVYGNNTELLAIVSSKLPPVCNEDFRIAYSGENEFQEISFHDQSIQYRMYLGIVIDNETLTKYINQKTEGYEREYLSKKVRQSFPALFQSYVACVIQLKESDQNTVLSTLLRVLVEEKVMPVVRSEALEALRWYVLYGKEKRRKSERFTRLVKLMPGLVESLFSELFDKPQTDWSDDPFSGTSFKTFPVEVASFLLIGSEAGVAELKTLKGTEENLCDRVIEWLYKEEIDKQSVALNYKAYQFGKLAKLNKLEDIGLDIISNLIRRGNGNVREKVYAGLAAGIAHRKEPFPESKICMMIINSCIVDISVSDNKLAQSAAEVVVSF